MAYAAPWAAATLAGSSRGGCGCGCPSECRAAGACGKASSLDGVRVVLVRESKHLQRHAVDVQLDLALKVLESDGGADRDDKPW